MRRSPAWSIPLLTILACTPTTPKDAAPVVAKAPASPATPEAPLERPVGSINSLIGNPVAELAQQVILQELDALEARIASTNITREELSIASDFLSPRDGRLNALVRQAAAESGIPSHQVERVLASDKWEPYLNYLRNNGATPVFSRRRELGLKRRNLPFARQQQGGCERVQKLVDENVDTCAGITNLRGVTQRRMGLGCRELRYDPWAHAQHCIEAGHEWAVDYLAEVERQAKIEEAVGRRPDRRWASRPPDRTDEPLP